MSELSSRDETEVRLDLPNPLIRRIGMFRAAYDRIVLAWHLLKDNRVGYAEKAIMALTIAYVLSPVDFLPALISGPLGLLDDLTILILGLNWFIQASPPAVVQEHMERLDLGFGT